MKLHQWTIWGLTVAALALAGCAVEPVTGRGQLVLSTEEDDALSSQLTWGNMKRTMKPCEAEALQAVVARVGARLAKVADPEGRFAWEYQVFSDPSPNAFCLPGGQVGVYDGLFQYVNNEAELAAVLGHEIAHAVARHGAERQAQRRLAQAGAGLLSSALDAVDAPETDRWLQAYAGISKVGFLYPYSRQHEISADVMGLAYMAQAGYDPLAAVEFWLRFTSVQAGRAEFFSTHPADQRRIAALRDNLQEAQVLYQQAAQRFGYGVRFVRN